MRKNLPKAAVMIPEYATRVFKGVIYDVYHWQQPMFDGTTATFEMLKRPDTLKVIVVDGDKLAVLEQQQPNYAFYDIPGGMHDKESEDELTAIKRELVEETGLVCKTWRLLSVKQPNKKIEQFVYIFLATDVIERRPQTLDAGEKITVHMLSLQETKKLLGSEKGRFLTEEIAGAASITDLLALPEYH